jgi:hypothetical protein
MIPFKVILTGVVLKEKYRFTSKNGKIETKIQIQERRSNKFVGNFEVINSKLFTTRLMLLSPHILILGPTFDGDHSPISNDGT